METPAATQFADTKRLFESCLCFEAVPEIRRVWVLLLVVGKIIAETPHSGRVFDAITHTASGSTAASELSAHLAAHIPDICECAHELRHTISQNPHQIDRECAHQTADQRSVDPCDVPSQHTPSALPVAMRKWEATTTREYVCGNYRFTINKRRARSQRCI